MRRDGTEGRSAAAQRGTDRFSEHRFVYPFHFETHVEREQTVKPGEAIQLFAPAEAGGYTATCRASTKDFIIDLEQPNMTIAYTDRYRYAEPDSINSSTNHLIPSIASRHSNESSTRYRFSRFITNSPPSVSL